MKTTNSQLKAGGEGQAQPAPQAAQQAGVRAEDRHAVILDRLSTGQKVSVKSLAEEFGVSEVTIRTDLDLLEREGKLKRVRGGAVMLDRMREVVDISRRMGINSDKKKAIARLAHGLVSDGDTIVIDSGSTAYELVKTLSDRKGLTVLTQDMSIATYVDSNLPDASVIMLGGALRPRHGYCWGPLTVSLIEQLYVDKAFVGANGVSMTQGFMTENPYTSQVKHALIEHARQSIMLIDSSKIGVHSFIKFADVSEVDYIVMDADPDGTVARAASLANPSPMVLLPS